MSLSYGRRLEKNVFGRCAHWEDNRQPTLVEFVWAIKSALFKQPDHWNPLSPSTVFGSKLLWSVRLALLRAMAGYSEEERSTLFWNTGLYTTLGTSADYWHHTDGAIFCDLGTGAGPLVTIDLKFVYEGKAPIRSSHFILTESDFVGTRNVPFRRIDLVAELIARELLNQYDHLAQRVYRKVS